MKQFMECICDDKLSVLDVHGNASATEIAEAWASLLHEYDSLIEPSEATFRAKLIGEIALWERILDIVPHWCEILKVAHYPNIAQAIRTVGYDYDFNPEDEAGYKHDIASVEAEMRALRLELRVKQAQFSAIIASQETTSNSYVVERKYFEQIFQAINNYRKWNCVNEQSTVLQFCVALKSYCEELKPVKK